MFQKQIRDVACYYLDVRKYTQYARAFLRIATHCVTQSFTLGQKPEFYSDIYFSEMSKFSNKNRDSRIEPEKYL